MEILMSLGINSTSSLSPAVYKQLFPGEINEKDAHGLFAFFLDGDFRRFQEQNKEAKIIKATPITSINPAHIKSLDQIQEIVKSNRLVALSYNQGKIEKMMVHPSWHERIIKENALNLAYRVEKEYAASENDFKLVKMTEQTYDNMVKYFRFDDVAIAKFKEVFKLT
jgi:hypothetical protein